MDDIFCRIVKGEIPAKKVYEDKHILVIEDIAPKAKIHLLIFPKRHIASLANQKESDPITREVFATAEILSRKFKVNKSGYRVLVNHGADAGQSINHIHFHFLAGEKLKDI